MASFPSLLEVYGLKEADPFEQEPKLKHPGSEPTSGIFTKKSQSRRAPGKVEPFKKRVDPGTEFLRQHGALGGLKGPGAGIPPKSMAPAGRSSQSAPVSKPSYRGQFVGQVANRGGKYEPRKVAWKDKETDKWRGGSVQSKVDQYAVWDGNDWVSSDEFDAQFGKKPGTKAP